jgi:hypothetical protein
MFVPLRYVVVLLEPKASPSREGRVQNWNIVEYPSIDMEQPRDDCRNLPWIDPTMEAGIGHER